MKVSYALCLLLASGAASAAPESSNETPPSAEFLEFLGEWQTQKGQLIDPFDLQESDERQDAASKPVEDQKHD